MNEVIRTQNKMLELACQMLSRTNCGNCAIREFCDKFENQVMQCSGIWAEYLVSEVEKNDKK